MSTARHPRESYISIGLPLERFPFERNRSNDKNSLMYGCPRSCEMFSCGLVVIGCGHVSGL